MARYRIAVCDDEPSELEDIVQSVKRYDVHGDFDIENYTDGAVLLSDLQLKKNFFDLLLLDIEMPSNGFQIAQTLTQMEKHPLVIFVTKRHEYAVQGYGIAFRYLVKPLDKSLFTAAMDAVVQELDSKHFTVEYEGATLSLETSDIYYLENGELNNLYYRVEGLFYYHASLLFRIYNREKLFVYLRLSTFYEMILGLRGEQR